MPSYDVVVIGAGQSGLAVGYHLARRGHKFLLVDAGPRTAHTWHARWDSLKLITPCPYNDLPGLPFPGSPWHFPTKAEVGAYLESYAAKFALPLRFNTRVKAVTRVGNQYRVDVGTDELEARCVVVATGPLSVPKIPAFSRDAGVFQIHSSQYKNPQSVPDGAILVVGGGHSGVGIAQDLARSRRVHLAARPLGSLPRSILGRDLFWWFHALGLTKITRESKLGRAWRSTQDGLIGVSLASLARSHGIVPRAPVESVDGDLVMFGDGTRARFDAIVWATGFSQDYRWIDAPVLDAAGAPVHRRGVTKSPGLYFLGLPWQHHVDSSLLGGVGADAEYLAEQIERGARRSRHFASSAGAFTSGSACR